MKRFLISFFLVFLTLPVYAGFKQQHNDPWPHGPCMSPYDGVSRAACTFKDSTIKAWDKMCMERLNDRVASGKLTGRTYDLKMLIEKGDKFCRCIVRRLQLEYTEEDFLERVYKHITKTGINPNGPNDLEAAYAVLEPTKICAQRLEILPVVKNEN
tara:strand:- start:18 stop:485 length:468 start_codon:yes stop_codon:yes gene_type:complete